jgi:hypothetical protein
MKSGLGTSLNITHAFLHLVVLVILPGCSIVPNSASTSGELSVESGGAIRLIMGGHNPSGSYVLETVTGEIVAETKYTPPHYSGSTAAKGVIWFKVNQRQLKYDTVKSCMRIRKADDSFLSVRVGLLSSNTRFALPSLEYTQLETVTIPSLTSELARIESDKNRRAQINEKLVDRSDYENGECSAPRLTNKPSLACLNRNESRAMNHDRCFSSNIVCNTAPSAAASLMIDGKLDRSSDLKRIAGTFAQYACSVSMDRRFGQETDIWTMARSYLIGVAVEKLYDELIRTDPELDQLAKDVITGRINYWLCLEDAYSACSRQADLWLKRTTSSYRQCMTLKRQFDDLDYRLNRVQPYIHTMQEDLKGYRKRLEHIRENHATRRGGAYWLHKGPAGC